jgi:hypothetical protein
MTPMLRERLRRAYDAAVPGSGAVIPVDPVMWDRLIELRAIVREVLDGDPSDQTDFSSRCDICGVITSDRLLDGAPHSWRWLRRLPNRFHRYLLQRASDRGSEFSLILCRCCYGPEWREM